MTATIRHRQRGTSLSETLFAIALIGIAALTASSLLNAHPRVAARLDAQHDLSGALEASLESLRAGALPLTDSSLRSPLPARPDLQLAVRVRELEPRGLYEVEVSAWCVVRGSRIGRSLTTRVWRPR